MSLIRSNPLKEPYMRKPTLLFLALITLSGSLFAEKNLLNLLGTDRINSAGEKISAECAPTDDQKLIGIYFSAHWCPPCRLFTPKLVDTYNLAIEEEKDFELVFVSFDRSEEDMLAYMKEANMPWLALPYESDATERAKTFKNDVLGSSGIPLLVILDAEGAVVTQSGRVDVENLGLRAISKWNKKQLSVLKRKTMDASSEDRKRASRLQKKKSPPSETPRELTPQEKAAFEKLSLRIKKEKLSGRECTKAGVASRERRNTDYEYDGYVYALEFRNNSEVRLKNLTVECRFFYTVKSSWRSAKRASKTEQKYEAHSFRAAMDASSKYKAETEPFVICSHSLPSGYYYYDRAAEVVEARADGLWVRVSYTMPDGNRLSRDFCEPSSLLNRKSWDGNSI